MPPKKKRLGKLTPLYTLVYSPLYNTQVETCPTCGGRVRKRLHEFVVYVEPRQLQGVEISMTTCARCEMVILDEPRFEEGLTRAFVQDGRAMFIGNEYHILGTMDASIKQLDEDVRLDFEEMLTYLHDIKEHVYPDFDEIPDDNENPT